jgi:hypothetical protein
MDGWQSGTTPLVVSAKTCHTNSMKNKQPISRNQRALLDGLCEVWDFDNQVAVAQELWPQNYSYIRKSFSRLQNLGFIEWISQEQTSYEPRWWVTEAGVRYIIDSK